PGASAERLGGVGGIAYANDTLIVADANRLAALPIHHRVLIFSNVSVKLPAPHDQLFQDQGKRCPVCVGAADVVLGQPDFDSTDLKAPSPTTLRVPTHVATDGRILVVSDTDNNRVLIYSSIPTSNLKAADVVVGQPDFTRVVPNDGQGFTPTNKSLKGPQGVWVQDGRLFVADSSNNRVLIWNSIPRTNGQPADVVLGAPDFNTFVQPDLTKATIDAQATTLLTPVSVTSDGVRLFVADLGHNRVLIWNQIPTRNQQPADVVLGQPDFTSAFANNSTSTSQLCPARAKDEEGNDIFPVRCLATMEFPRFALSDGRRLFIADGGNDRILVYNSIPTQNGAKADSVIGQFVDDVNVISDSDPNGISSAGAVRTPSALAWDGTNLYATDPFNRRIMIFTPGERLIPNTGVRNAASRNVFAVGTLAFSGQIKADDEVTIKISDREYKYKLLANDSFEKVINELIARINAGDGDPQVFASPNLELGTIVLTSKIGGIDGNNIEYSVSTSTGAVIVFATSGTMLAGGQDAAKIAPGTIVSLFGENLSPERVSAAPDAAELPTELGQTQVYFDGIRAPLLFVSPQEIRAQVPVEVIDSQSINAYVRTVRPDGRVVVTTAIAVPVVPENPGIFAQEDAVDPRPGVIYHFSSHATGTVLVDGASGLLTEGDTATVVIEDRPYTITLTAEDTLESVRDKLIDLINANEPKVEAFLGGHFTRIRLRARVPGPVGNGIAFTARTNEGASVILTATNQALCCANEAGAPVTEENPALPGETILLYATGLGIVKPEGARAAQFTGKIYEGPELNEPVQFVNSLAGAKTANVLYAGLRRGAVGLYEVHLELNSDIPTNSRTQMTIAQGFFVSNIVTFPVFNPNQPAPDP
ncbi:MAG: hypothetical protein ACRD44_01745, partial [Bryobacteraceae bacterium]